MNQNVKTHFDRLSSNYGTNFSSSKSGKTYEFRQRMKIVEGLTRGVTGSLLDCACGTGEISSAALQAGAFTYATLVDVSEAMLERASATVESSSYTGTLECRNTDIFAYEPAGNVSFDVILCLGLIAHTGRLTELLRHLKGMLARDGTIILQTSVGNHAGVRIVHRLMRKRYFERHGYNLSYYTMRDLESSSLDANLVLCDVQKYCFGFPFGDQIFARGNYWLERIMSPFAARVGSEAIVTLRHGEAEASRA